jgi:hypothetical protein
MMADAERAPDQSFAPLDHAAARLRAMLRATPGQTAREVAMTSNTAAIVGVHIDFNDGAAAGRRPAIIALETQLHETTLAIEALQRDLAAAQVLTLAETRIAEEKQRRSEELLRAQAAGEADSAVARAELDVLREDLNALLRAQSYRAREVAHLDEAIAKLNAHVAQLRNLKRFAAAGGALPESAIPAVPAIAAPVVAARAGIAAPEPDRAAAPIAPSGAPSIGPPGAGAVVDYLIQSLLAAQDAATKRDGP